MIFDEEKQEEVLETLKRVDYNTLKETFLEYVPLTVDYPNLFQMFEALNPEEAKTYIEEFYVDHFNNIEEVKRVLGLVNVEVYEVIVDFGEKNTETLQDFPKGDFKEAIKSFNSYVKKYIEDDNIKAVYLSLVTYGGKHSIPLAEQIIRSYKINEEIE